eukprot:2230352-Prorocentrum_lima.AAC.1
MKHCVADGYWRPFTIPFFDFQARLAVGRAGELLAEPPADAEWVPCLGHPTARTNHTVRNVR